METAIVTIVFLYMIIGGLAVSLWLIHKIEVKIWREYKRSIFPVPPQYYELYNTFGLINIKIKGEV